MKWAITGSIALLAFSLTACDSLSELTELEVVNENNPERQRALQEAGDVESLISSGFYVAWDATFKYGSGGMMLSATADETSCSWGNWGLMIMSSEPRVAWPNTPAASYAQTLENPWYDRYASLSGIYDGLLAIEDDPLICDQIDCDRALAFARFTQGYAHAYLALVYDSAFVFDETVDLDNDVLGLTAYPGVMDAAIGYLQEAITLSTGANWSTETSWMNGYPHTAAEFAQIAHSFIAQFLVMVARTPAERAAVDWPTVINHIDQGYPDDLFIMGDGCVNWDHNMLWYGSQPTSSTWGRADYKTIGWSELDVGPGTGYADWLNTAVGDRDEFELHVQDLRIMPHPDSTRAPGLDFMYYGPSAFRPIRGTYHFSFYIHSKYSDYNTSGCTTPMPFLLRQPMELMKAEGLLRTGDPAGAADIVNETRVTRGGLPAATAADANLMDRLIYEYRMENFVACPGCAFFNRRGWGGPAATGPNHHQGLVEGTQLHFAVPGKELEILQKLWYTYGGVGNEGGSLAPSASPGMRNSGTQTPARMVYAFDGMKTAREKLDYIYRDSGKGARAAMLTRH